jgi:hypothetical protein
MNNVFWLHNVRLSTCSDFFGQPQLPTVYDTTGYCAERWASHRDRQVGL